MEMIVITGIGGREKRLRQRVRRNSSRLATPNAHFRHLGHVDPARARPCRRRVFSSEISRGDNRPDLVTERSLRAKMQDSRGSFHLFPPSLSLSLCPRRLSNVDHVPVIELITPDDARVFAAKLPLANSRHREPRRAAFSQSGAQRRTIGNIAVGNPETSTAKYNRDDFLEQRAQWLDDF